jgi:nucleoside-diphosphate-sugar epimerase
MKILITGASGYIGTSLVNLARTHRHEVVAASRHPLDSTPSWLPFDLHAASSLKIPEGIDAIIHLAVETTKSGDDGQNEIEAAKALIIVARKIGAKFVFVSSQTAREDAPTSYGRTKWRIEQEVLAANGIIVRLGQVYGGVEKGLFGTLVLLVRRFPILPAFFPPPLIQPIHVDDCTKGLLKFIERDDLVTGVYSLASIDTVSFTELLRSIVNYRVRRHRIFLPIPVRFIRFSTKLFGKKISTKLGLHRLISLFDLVAMDTAVDLEAIGLELRPFDNGMHRSGNDRRRRLFKEGKALLAYVLRAKPGSTLVRRYARSIEELRAGKPLALPPIFLKCPTALALLDDHSFIELQSGSEFGWRVDAATIIAEASVQGVDRFISEVSKPRTIALTKMFIAISAELFWRLSRPIVLLVFRRIDKIEAL